MTGGGLRKRPLQERSKATTQRILDTASQLLVDVGYEAITASPTLLLQASGVSRGSFYAFFETPEKVLDELAFQCMLESAAQFRHLLRTRPITHWHNVVDILIDFYMGCYQRPVVRELWVGQHLTPPARAADREWMRDVGEALLPAFKRFAPAFENLALRQCLVTIEICERLFQYAYTGDSRGDQRIVDEIRVVLRQYLSHYARAGEGEPAGRARSTVKTKRE